nr:MAG TPA: hypothetical protein [Caudoviricetes sp.]
MLGKVVHSLTEINSYYFVALKICSIFVLTIKEINYD